MNIIVSGGGTGGHIYPAITLIRAIKEKVPEAVFLYVGTKKGLEADIVPKEGIPFATVELEGFKRSLTPENFVRAARALKASARAAGMVKGFKPDVVIGTGGYVCGPVLLAASLMGVPTLIQEQNVLPGITNKILSRFVTKIAVGAKGALKYFPSGKAVFTGNPIRREVMEATREEGAAAFGFDAAKKTILVSGGSRGARAINNAMVGVIKARANDASVQILHVTGKLDYESVREKLAAEGLNELPAHVKVVPYLYDMPKAEALADMAVFRAGATGLAELTARGIPAILVPYPYAAENHQEFNAREVEKAGAARVILNKDLTGDVLSQAIEEMLAGDLAGMAAKCRALGRPEAAETIADLALSIAKRKG